MSWKGDLLKAGISSDGERVQFFNSNQELIDVIETEVDASGGGSGEEDAIGTVPAGSVLLGVVINVTENFDGDTTQTIEVGLTGNTDKYIDPTDIDPSTGTPQLSNFESDNADQGGMTYLGSDEAIVATWTNTANATAGKAKVYLIYANLNE